MAWQAWVGSVTHDVGGEVGCGKAGRARAARHVMEGLAWEAGGCVKREQVT